MRYLIQMGYDGTQYSGWQSQDNAVTVQGEIEHWLSTVLKTKISIVGCGRTDTGVHARQYFFHTDLPERVDPDMVLNKLNRVTQSSLGFYSIRAVNAEFSARFDAVARAYKYYIHFNKNPFINHSYYYNQKQIPSIEKLNEAAKVLLDYPAYFPFCKTNSDVKHYGCKLVKSQWVEAKNGQYVYEIEANRFLRGMVRLVVGMCINVAIGRLDLFEVVEAMESQTRLSRDWSVPAKGLFLEKVVYDL